MASPYIAGKVENTENTLTLIGVKWHPNRQHTADHLNQVCDQPGRMSLHIHTTHQASTSEVLIPTAHGKIEVEQFICKTIGPDN